MSKYLSIFLAGLAILLLSPIDVFSKDLNQNGEEKWISGGADENNIVYYTDDGSKIIYNVPVSFIDYNKSINDLKKKENANKIKKENQWWEYKIVCEKDTVYSPIIYRVTQKDDTYTLYVRMLLGEERDEEGNHLSGYVTCNTGLAGGKPSLVVGLCDQVSFKASDKNGGANFYSEDAPFNIIGFASGMGYQKGKVFSANDLDETFWNKWNNNEYLDVKVQTKEIKKYVTVSVYPSGDWIYKGGGELIPDNLIMEYSSDISAMFHNHVYFENEIKKASCMENGVMIKKCSCGRQLGSNIGIKAKGHQFGSWQDYNETYHKRSCLVCGYIDYEKHMASEELSLLEEGHHNQVCMNADCKRMLSDKVNTYYILFDSNGGKGKINPVKLSYNKTFMLPKEGIEKKVKVEYIYQRFFTLRKKAEYNLTLEGWTDGRKRYKPTEVVSNLTSNHLGQITLSAVWNKSTISLPDASRKNYEFLGWSENKKDAQGIKGEYEITENTKLYAIWKKCD